MKVLRLRHIVNSKGDVLLQKRIPTDGQYPPPGDKLCASKKEARVRYVEHYEKR